MELNRLSWETFTRTGDIDAYLLYKTVSGITEQEDIELEAIKIDEKVIDEYGIEWLNDYLA